MELEIASAAVVMVVSYSQEVAGLFSVLGNSHNNGTVDQSRTYQVLNNTD